MRHHEFQVFAKPVGAACNLACSYCYYLEKEALYPGRTSMAMPDTVLDAYIRQIFSASRGPAEVRFSWHGGEPTILGMEFFKKVISLQEKYNPQRLPVINNIQTNGVLIDEKWCEFLAEAGFTVGLSLDGPEKYHNAYRIAKGGSPTHDKVMQAWQHLNRFGVTTDILCVVNAANVGYPDAVYDFFKEMGARYIGFLPIVREDRQSSSGVSAQSVPRGAFGEFLATVFDRWKKEDIGKVLVQIFEEVARTALGQEHSLCIFRPTCGNFPVVERNGDFYACDHFVHPDYLMGNICQAPISSLLGSRGQKAFGQAKRRLPDACRICDVLAFCNGGCPKDRFVPPKTGSVAENYLCADYKLFFRHCLPFATALKQQYHRQQESNSAKRANKVSRNAPCPCGSGKKYKKCCMMKK